jgi:hypothetical protein
LTHQEYIDSLKTSAVKLGSSSALLYIFTVIPFLKAPLLKQITEKIVESVISIFVNKTEMASFFFYIDTRTSHQGEVFSQMAYRNFIAQKNGTEQEKKIAEENLIASFKNFASLRS